MKNDFRIASLKFRRIASNMLNTDADTSTVNLIRFKQFIDSNPIISKIIRDKISGIEYDFRDCFTTISSGWNTIKPPVDEACHLKAQYDYISHICSQNIIVEHIAYGFPRGSSSRNEIVRGFIDNAFKPLVDFVTDSLSKEIMLLEEDKPVGNITQNIDKNYGTINAAGRDIQSSNTTLNKNIDEIKDLIEKLLPTISSTSGLTTTEKEDLTDDLDTVNEQIESDEPKVSRIRKAYENIKGFVSKASKAAELSSLLLVDWSNLVDKVGHLLNNIK